MSISTPFSTLKTWQQSILSRTKVLSLYSQHTTQRIPLFITKMLTTEGLCYFRHESRALKECRRKWECFDIFFYKSHLTSLPSSPPRQGGLPVPMPLIPFLPIYYFSIINTQDQHICLANGLLSLPVSMENMLWNSLPAQNFVPCHAYQWKPSLIHSNYYVLNAVSNAIGLQLDSVYKQFPPQFPKQVGCLLQIAMCLWLREPWLLPTTLCCLARIFAKFALTVKQQSWQNSRDRLDACQHISK